MGCAGGDIVRVVELHLSSDAADFVVLDRTDGLVDRRHGEQAVEERQLLLTGGNRLELARDDEILGAAVTEVLASGDLYDELGLVRARGRRASRPVAR